MQNGLRLEQIKERSQFSSFMVRISLWVLFQIEQQKPHALLWIPVIFAIGIAVYFALSTEPPFILCTFIWSVFMILHILAYPLRYRDRLYHKALYFLTLISVLIASGFFAAKARTAYVDAPLLYKKIGPVDVHGTITAIDLLEKGSGVRLVLGGLTIENLSPDKTPRKIRLRLRDDDSDTYHNLSIGDEIEGLAMLNPPSAPFTPDGFDFRRYLYFQGIGAVGFFYRTPAIIQNRSPPSINALRHIIADRISEHLPSRQSAVATALIVGEKRGLSDEDQSAIRDAGMAHMLAISGLHVGLVAGVLFFILRLIMAGVPTIALRYPIKKVAAIGALCGAVFYMLLAGSTIPTQRAVIMTSIVFLAIILDRSPFSLRLVSFAALIVLCISPESLLSASFHLSFAAVTGLIYFYDLTRIYWSNAYKHIGAVRKIMLYMLGVCITTIIASIVTAPFALYHFGHVSVMGSIANVVGVPLLGFVIMPFALLSLILMPFGLEVYPLYIAGYGISGILDIAHWASSLPHAVARFAAWDFTAFVMFVCGCLFFILWRGWGKLLCIPILVTSFIISTSTRPADILIAPSHKLFSFYNENTDTLFVSSYTRERFIRENWQEYYGLEKEHVLRLPYKGGESTHDFYQCGAEGCRFNISNRKVSFIKSQYNLSEECHWADIILSVEPSRPSLYRKNRCKNTIIIDKFDSWRNGAYAIWVNNGDFSIKTSADQSSNRPWSLYHND